MNFLILLLVVELELCHMGFNVIGCRPTHHQIAMHFLRSFRRLAAGPERDQETGDDRAVGLDRDSVLVVAE